MHGEKYENRIYRDAKELQGMPVSRKGKMHVEIVPVSGDEGAVIAGSIENPMIERW